MVLPADARPYRRITEATAPRALLEARTTRQDVRALIHVLEGQPAYRIEDRGRPRSETAPTAQTPPGVAGPTIRHAVEPRGRVRLHVEFHRRERI